MFLYIGLALLAAGVWLALEYASTSQREIRAQLRRAGAYAVVDDREKELSRSAKDRLFLPAVHKLSSMAMRMSPQASRIQLARKLQSAGVKTSPQVFLAIKAGLPLLAVAGGLVGLIVLAQAAALPIGFGIATLCWIGPDFYLSKRAAARKDLMGRRLPDTLDLLTVSVEAGLGFDAAIAKVCEKMQGPLIDELDIMAREIRIGESRRQALRNLSDRVGSPEVASFARSIIQAEELGTALGRTLRVQSVDMRIKRQLEAEEKAMKAPVKMLFPTVLFIFPAMFIVILGPAFINIMDSMSNL